MTRAVLFTSFLFLSLAMRAQDTLPSFAVSKKIKGSIIVKWVNPYKDNIRQLSIQRSFDSLKQFKSIITMPDPTTPQNGFVDNQAPQNNMFYRIYILLDSGKYVFSKSKRPVLDTAKVTAANKEESLSYITSTTSPRETLNAKSGGPERFIFIKKLETVVAMVSEKQLKRYKDSLNYKTRDTIYYESSDTLMIKPFIPKEAFRISKYVFTEKEGRVKISLPDAVDKKYSVKFFEEDSTFLFEIKKINQPLLMLDKSNFVHAGWFRFELYDNGTLKEKQKLYIPKDF